MKINVGTVKGFQDFLPPESIKRDAVKRIVEKWYRLYGFIPIETPIIEYDELIKGDNIESEDEAISERFKLRDRGGRNLGLRYEFTFQLARIFAETPNIKLPFKRYQIGPVFRDEPTGPERFRQFTQCDIDIVGDASIGADAECLAVFSDILKELKIKPEIQVNNRKLLNAIIESVQIQAKQQVMRELDKIDKIGEDDVKSNLRKYADTNQIVTLFKLLEKDLKFFKNNAFDGSGELQNLMDECKSYGVKLKFSPFMIRGFEYYTGNIFEIKMVGKKETIAAGGRYDRTVGKYTGKEMPAVGISFGLARLTSLAETKLENIPKALLISINQDQKTIKLANGLRKQNISCSILSGKPGKALEYANSLQIPYAVFIGSEEIENKKFKLKDMKSGDEKLLSDKQLIKALSKK